jgi:hypothetical protein
LRVCFGFGSTRISSEVRTASDVIKVRKAGADNRSTKSTSGQESILLARIEHPRYVAVYDLNSYRAISAVVASETTDDWKGPVEVLVELA